VVRFFPTSWCGFFIFVSPSVLCGFLFLTFRFGAVWLLFFGKAWRCFRSVCICSFFFLFSFFFPFCGKLRSRSSIDRELPVASVSSFSLSRLVASYRGSSSRAQKLTFYCHFWGFIMAFLKSNYCRFSQINKVSINLEVPLINSLP
jgi:hypothetical protein